MEGYLLIWLSLPAVLTYVDNKFDHLPTQAGHKKQAISKQIFFIPGFTFPRREVRITMTYLWRFRILGWMIHGVIDGAICITDGVRY